MYMQSSDRCWYAHPCGPFSVRGSPRSSCFLQDARSLSLHLHQQHRPMQDCMVTLPQPLLCPLCLYQHQGELLLCGVSSELTVHLMPLLATDNQQAFTLEHLQVGQRHGSPTSHLTAELTAAHLQQIGQPKLSVAVGSHLVVATSQGVMLRATLTGHAGKHKITWSELRMKSRRLTIFRCAAMEDHMHAHQPGPFLLCTCCCDCVCPMLMLCLHVWQAAQLHIMHTIVC